jgi:mRNA interferase MazF
MGVVKVARFDVVLVALDPTQGAEIQKTRPCVIVSPDELNYNIKTVIVAPMTTKSKYYPWRVPVKFQEKSGEITLDQIRTIDKSRIIKTLGTLDELTSSKLLDVLAELFS